MKRNIILINEELCNGCGACIDGCHEGALQMIDKKARIVSELYCDGLGACIGECPVGAITIEEREADAYDEIAVMERISQKGEAVILAHLKHLKEHGETLYFEQGVAYMVERGIKIDLSSLSEEKPKMACGCPGSMARSFTPPAAPAFSPTQNVQQSQLTHWPVQLHLLNPDAGYFLGADVVLAADCSAYAIADFHNRFLLGKKLAIACPKLDSNKEEYITKLVQMIDSSKINTLTVIIMEVPCCGGLIQLAQIAAQKALRRIPIKRVIVGVQGEVKNENWI